MLTNANTLMKLITQGVYVISVNNNQQQNAFTAAWVMQVSFKPLLICFSINSQSCSYPLLKQSGTCCISILNKQQFAEAEHFGQTDIADKMAGFKWLKTETGAPALADSIAYFDCRVDHYSEAGDHQLVICKVVNGVLLNKDEPMLYCDTADMDGSSQLYDK